MLPDLGTPQGGYLTWVTPPGGVPDLGTSPRGVTWPGYPPRRGVLPDLGTPPGGVPDLGNPPGGVPDLGNPPGGGPDPGTPPGGTPPPLPHGILGNVAKHYGIWVPPLWTDRLMDGQTRVKTLPSLVLRTRAVMKQLMSWQQVCRIKWRHNVVQWCYVYQSFAERVTEFFIEENKMIVRPENILSKLIFGQGTKTVHIIATSQICIISWDNIQTGLICHCKLTILIFGEPTVFWIQADLYRWRSASMQECHYLFG